MFQIIAKPYNQTENLVCDSLEHCAEEISLFNLPGSTTCNFNSKALHNNWGAGVQPCWEKTVSRIDFSHAEGLTRVKLFYMLIGPDVYDKFKLLIDGK